MPEYYYSSPGVKTKKTGKGLDAAVIQGTIIPPGEDNGEEIRNKIRREYFKKWGYA